MRIFLTGFMGCGKSTVGKRLALHMGYSFIDTDKVISEKHGLSIPDYFHYLGEDTFRKEETDVLKQLADSKNTIISTGGGMPCFNNNMSYMNSLGCTVYLSMTPAQLAQRLEKGRYKRPLLAAIPPEKLTDYITEKLALREYVYRQALITVNAYNINIKHLASMLKKCGKKGISL